MESRTTIADCAAVGQLVEHAVHRRLAALGRQLSRTDALDRTRKRGEERLDGVLRARA